MGADDIAGRVGDDALHSVLGTDEVRGEDGHYYVVGGRSFDDLFGGPADDTAYVDATSTPG